MVYVVGDDPSLLRAVPRLLRAAGFETEVFSSAEDFLLHRLRYPDVPGCVIFDFQMPGLHGLEVQKIIRQQKEPLPVIFLAGHSDLPGSVRILKVNDVDFLTKPVTAEALVAAVKCAMARDVEAREVRRQERELVALYEGLNYREREALFLIARGLRHKQIGFELSSIEHTIKIHGTRVMAKMRVQSLAELVRVTERLDHILKRAGRQA